MLNRRDFLKLSGITVAAFSLPVKLFAASEQRPNILWISTEDISPDLGCYGDEYATTPNIDKFASTATRFDNAFAHAGVCAPARSGIITSMHPTTIGTNNMRCKGVVPAPVRCFTEYLRRAGYYCTNQSKTDYQFDSPLTAWDDNSKKAHWRNRPSGKPFFSVINFTSTHESQIRAKYDSLVHDPDKAKVPPYYPDTEVTRKDWARYYDIITKMDGQVAGVLQQLKDDGLADDTIVWFWGDHGRGLPRGKRWIYDSGIKVPLIIHVPEKFREMAGLKGAGSNSDLVSFIDFGATMLSLAGVNVPGYMHGKPFMGPKKAEPREYIYAARDRMDEAYDLIRAVRDKRYKYIRNFMPHLTYGQDIDYMNQMPTMREMRKLNAEGKLVGAQKNYFLPTKPVEELYDTVNDPHEINNLAGDSEHQPMLLKMRKVLTDWMMDTRDTGLIPEPDFDEMKRPGGKYEKTANPAISTAGIGGKLTVAISCITDNSSIAYAIDGGSWKLYTEPFDIAADQKVKAKACRIGFKDSDTVEFVFGEERERVSVKKTSYVSWYGGIDDLLLESLLEIKALDLEGEQAAESYIEALDDMYGPVRYWAIIGLHNYCKDETVRASALFRIEQLLSDVSPSVRVAAAEMLVQVSDSSLAMDVLVKSLKQGSDTERLFAITALKRLGPKARPAKESIKLALDDKYGYVPRTAKYIIEDLAQ